MKSGKKHSEKCTGKFLKCWSYTCLMMEPFNSQAVTKKLSVHVSSQRRTEALDRIVPTQKQTKHSSTNEKTQQYLYINYAIEQHKEESIGNNYVNRHITILNRIKWLKTV